MNPEIKKKYALVKKIAKQQGITTVEELSDIISEHFEEATGADFEIIKKSLKISRF